MDDDSPAIEVQIVRDSHLTEAPSDPVSIPVKAIASIEDARPVGPFRRGQPRCRIVLLDPAAQPVPWVFRVDADQEPRPRELWVAETLMQVTALMASAARNNRSVSVEDLGREVAAAAIRPVPEKPLRLLRVSKRAQTLPGT